MEHEKALEFSCGDTRLYGILHAPENPRTRAILIVVGGPQYRVGSHRQFVLLARRVAALGFPVLRFDHRGVGDSGGDTPDFENLDPDIHAAMGVLLNRIPGIREVVIWGLCDAASAAMIYAHQDDRIKGMVLLNPWVRSDQGLARANISLYYGSQLRDADFWRRVFRGKVNIFGGLRSMFGQLLAAVRPASLNDSTAGKTQTPFQRRMERGLAEFTGRVLIILSGQDITANEFSALTGRDRRWRRILRRPSCQVRRIAEANHTFSSREWRDLVEQQTIDWLESW